MCAYLRVCIHVCLCVYMYNTYECVYVSICMNMYMLSVCARMILVHVNLMCFNLLDLSLMFKLLYV